MILCLLVYDVDDSFNCLFSSKCRIQQNLQLFATTEMIACKWERIAGSLLLVIEDKYCFSYSTVLKQNMLHVQQLGSIYKH